MKTLGIILGASVAMIAPALADNTDPNASDTPAMATDRPGKSHAATTVDTGHWQFEGDFANLAWNHWSNMGASHQSMFLDTNVKYGLSDSLELDIITPGLMQSTVANHTIGGIGDTWVGGKVNLFGNSGGDQSLGVIGFIKLPTATPGLGNNMVEGSLNVPFTTVLPQKFSLTIEPAIGVFRNANKQGYEADYQMIFNLSRPISSTVTVAMELALDYSGDHNIGPRHTFDPSIQWLVTPWLQLDVGAYIGLTKSAPAFNPYTGFAMKF